LAGFRESFTLAW